MSYCVEFILVGIGFFWIGFIVRNNIEPYWD